MEKEQKHIRPENLLKALGIDSKGLSDEERQMKELLTGEYRKRKKSLFTEIRRWREAHPDKTLGDSIRALYEELEKET